jgi:hypothetical protein
MNSSRVDNYSIFYLLQWRRTSLLSRHAFKHSRASIRSSPRAFRSGAMSLCVIECGRGSGRGEGAGGWGKGEREKEVAGKGGREVDGMGKIKTT